MPIEQRSYVGGNFAFELDGVKCGFIRSVDGGAIYADVIQEPLGPDYFAHKHIGNPKYESIAIEVELPLPKTLFEWVGATWQGKYARKDGAIVACDFLHNAVSAHEFQNALLTEVTIPACDGASKEPAYISVQFAPELIRLKKAAGKYDVAAAVKQQKWLPANFRLEIADLDCSRVSSIDAFTIKQTSVGDDVGETRDYAREPGKLEFPNLRITLAESSAQSWHDWFEDFVINGNNGQEKEKTGRLTFLSPDRQTELAHIDLFNLGIFRLAAAQAASAEAVSRVVAELYCERMELHGGGENVVARALSGLRTPLIRPM